MKFLQKSVNNNNNDEYIYIDKNQMIDMLQNVDWTYNIREAFLELLDNCDTITKQYLKDQGIEFEDE